MAIGTGDAIRERDFYTRTRCVMLNKTLREVKKTLPQESTLGGNTTPCKMNAPNPRKIWL